MNEQQYDAWLGDLVTEVKAGPAAVLVKELRDAQMEFMASIEAELRAMGGAMPVDVPVTWNWR